MACNDKFCILFLDHLVKGFTILLLVSLSQQTFTKERKEVKINANALVALALLVAQTDPQNKDLMISLINNLT